jgi:hypothetical protein
MPRSPRTSDEHDELHPSDRPPRDPTIPLQLLVSGLFESRCQICSDAPRCGVGAYELRPDLAAHPDAPDGPFILCYACATIALASFYQAFRHTSEASLPPTGLSPTDP